MIPTPVPVQSPTGKHRRNILSWCILPIAGLLLLLVGLSLVTRGMWYYYARFRTEVQSQDYLLLTRLFGEVPSDLRISDVCFNKHGLFQGFPFAFYRVHLPAPELDTLVGKRGFFALHRQPWGSLRWPIEGNFGAYFGANTRVLTTIYVLRQERWFEVRAGDKRKKVSQEVESLAFLDDSTSPSLTLYVYTSPDLLLDRPEDWTVLPVKAEDFH